VFDGIKHLGRRRIRVLIGVELHQAFAGLGLEAGNVSRSLPNAPANVPECLLYFACVGLIFLHFMISRWNRQCSRGSAQGARERVSLVSIKEELPKGIASRTNVFSGRIRCICPAGMV
jgi:hypothetical protein